MTRWQWLLGKLTRRLWWRASLFGALGVATAVLSAFVEPYIPWELEAKIGADAVDGILEIIASSMLAVTTFSLSVMTSAYSSATSNVTPRATTLIMEDRLTQTVLSTFIGSFLFAIVGIVVLQTGAYGERGRVILFVATIFVIALIVVSLLRWIDHLTRLGRVGETTNRVEEATHKAIAERVEQPFLGAHPLRDPAREVPKSAGAITANCIGYIQHVDLTALDACAEAADGRIFIAANPGAFVYPDTPLAWLDAKGKLTDEQQNSIRTAFSVGTERNFDQDPRFGLAVMSEIACRALSPAVNDPGTAIDVIGRLTRLLGLWAESPPAPPDEVRFPRLYLPPLASDDLFEDAFMPMARDGAGMIEVQLRLQKALGALGGMGDRAFAAAARKQAQLAIDRAERALDLPADRQRLRAVFRQAAPSPRRTKKTPG